MQGQRLRVVLLVAILGVATIAATATVLGVLYRSTLDVQRGALVDLVTAREALVDAVYAATGSEDETLRMLMVAQREAPHIGTTGELTVATRDGDDIRFLVQPRYAGAASVVSGSGLAEPMARALAGGQGTMIGRDYRGERVLAAYRDVHGPRWGLVAKIDLAEIRAPFLEASAVAAAVTGILVILGAWLFTRVTSPMIDAVSESEARFRTAFEQAAVGIAHVAPDGSWLRVNRRLCEIVGYSHEELVALTFRDLTHPDDQAEDEALIARVLAGEIDSYRLEKRYLRKGGTIVWIRLTVSLVRDPGGQPSYFVSVVEDVTDRVEHESALRERVKELRCLYGVSAAIEDEGRPLVGMLQMIPPLITAGWLYPEITRARVVLDDAEAASPGFEPTRWRQSADIVVAGETRGRIDVCLAAERPEADEGPFLKEERALLEDIADRIGQAVERREVRAELSASEKRYRTIFDTVPASIWDEDWSEVVDLVRRLRDGGVTDFRAYLDAHPEVVQDALARIRIRDVNRETLAMFDARDRSDLLASLETVFSTPDTLPGFVGELVALAEGRETYRTEMALRTVNGEKIHVLLTMSFPGPDTDDGDVTVSLMDVTGRVKAEAALRESEARFRTMFERSTVGKSLTAPDGRLLEVNPAFAAMLGYSVEELRKLDFPRLTHPDDVAESRECVRRLLAGERTTYRMEKRYLARDGHEVWADVSTTLLRDEAGEPRYFITAIVDVTDKVRAQRELLAEKTFSDAMLTSLPGVAYLFGDDLRFRRWNANFEAVTGRTAEEFAGLSPLDLFPAADRERVAERIREVFETGASSVEAELLARDGGTRPYLFTGRLVEIGGARYLIGVGIDISVRKRAEAELAAVNAELEARVARRARELHQAHERLSFVIGATPAVIYTCRAEGDFAATFVADNVTGLLGHPPEAFTSSPSFWLEHVHPEDRERVLADLAQALEKNDRHAHEYRFLHADGGYRWVRDELRLVRDADGRPAELVGAWIDVTERRESEVRIERLNRELRHTVEQLTSANQELESFSYTVSHDLRSPLRAIDGFSRILLEEHATELEGEARRYLDIVRENTRTMGQLIDDLLAFSRISRQELRREPVALDDVVDEAWGELAPARDGRSIEVERAPLPRVRGDARLLKLVFTNLLGNAVKFTRRRESARIEIGARRDDGAAVVFVRDNGAGFDMRYVDKLFGVFQRLHKAAEFEGTGVGLATVARIIHRHGGRVWAEGEPGAGATFYLAFEEGEEHGADQSG